MKRTHRKGKRKRPIRCNRPTWRKKIIRIEGRVKYKYKGKKIKGGWEKVEGKKDLSKK